ncbi:MAG: LysR family transcriptional regulator [Clostridiales bacterium]|nr:LysR family transcriptional regulator [Clostridiales bacterium]
MTLKQLQYFMAVARSLNFTEAAKDLFISQPALSRSIAELEAELDVPLLIRDHHSVSLTPAGILLASELPKWKMELERILLMVRQTGDGLMGRLNVGIQDGQKIDETILVSFDYFRQSLPLVEISPYCQSFVELTDGLARDKLDIIVTLDYGLSERFDLQTLELDSIKNCMALPARHPLSGKSTALLSEFAKETFIIEGNEASPSTKFLLEACRTAGFTPSLKPVPDIRTQLLMIESGFGVSVFNAKSEAFLSAGLKAVPLTDVPPSRLLLAWKKDATNPSIRLFVHLMQCCL